MADNERHLRSLPYFEDARFWIRPIEGTEWADVIIVIKDVFSFGFDLNLSSANAGRVELFNSNFLGLGHQISHMAVYNNTNAPIIGYQGKYAVKNIGRSFINSEVRLANYAGEHSWGMSLNRDFYTPNIKYAGGLSFDKISRSEQTVFSE